MGLALIIHWEDFLFNGLVVITRLVKINPCLTFRSSPSQRQDTARSSRIFARPHSSLLGNLNTTLLANITQGKTVAGDQMIAFAPGTDHKIA